MKKKKIIFIVMVFVILLLSFGCYEIWKFYKQFQIDHAVKIVKLKKDNVEVFEDLSLKDLIEEINGTLIDNPKIDTTTVGSKELSFSYINDDNIKIPYTIYINVEDKVPPIISQPSLYPVNVSSTTKEELQESFFCGDNYDDEPKCTLNGEYDLETVGDYEVTLKGEDSSGNVSEHTFILRVRQKPKSGGSSYEPSFTDFEEIKKKYKTEDTKIGIDISHWQGTIDFKQAKESGVEFVYIRVGRGNGIGKEYVLDDKFEEYIKGFNEVNIPVGVYFYSNANSREDAIKEAKWVLKKIKKYKVDLEIAFDWENWAYYQEYSLSFYHLSEAAEAFMNTVEKAGYQGMLYSSKNYLENIWFPTKSNVWLAHYTNQTNYEGKYKVWQLCNDGKVNGINDNYVDINIRY